MPSRPPAAAPSAAQPPGTDWQDSYFTLEQRLRHVQRALNDKEEELKMAKVAQRKAAAPPLNPARASAASVQRARDALRRGGVSASTSASRNPTYTARQRQDSLSASRPIVFAAASPSAAAQAGPSATQQHRHMTAPSVTWADSTVKRRRGVRLEDETVEFDGVHDSDADYSGEETMPVEYVRVPSAAKPDAARAAAISEASLWGPAGSLPDPAMVWGSEGSIQNYVAASALYHANEELRRKLNESSSLLQSVQQELSSTRALHTKTIAKVEDLTLHVHQLVRERDLATQKCASTQQTITDLQRTLQNRVAEEEKARFSLDSQIGELRSRLVAGADSNELLSKDVRVLLTEAREKTGEVMKVRSKLSLVESALTSQRNTNENLLVELKSLNAQLMDERRRLLLVMKDAQLGALSRDRVSELEAQIQQLTSERTAMEQQHVKLMAEYVGVTDDALQHARQEVAEDIADWRKAALQWESVSQLLYKDIAERTQTHIRCREECEAAKAQRDGVAMELSRLRVEVELCRAKLHVVWPNHAVDTEGLTAEDIHGTFGDGVRIPLGRDSAAAKWKKRAAAGTAGGSSSAAPPLASDEGGVAFTAFDADEAAKWDLAHDATTAAEQLLELHEANAGLLAELEQLRLTNELLQIRITTMTGKRKTEKEEVSQAAKALAKREAAGQRLLEKQLERVQFLESQVVSLRGYDVAADTAVESLNANENVLELFLGQLVAAEVPDSILVPDLFSHIFCSADFLVHETVTTPPITGFNGFFDTSISFCISMDTLLLYYLRTRDLLVQLHRMRSDNEVQELLQLEDAATESEDGATGQSSTGGGSSTTGAARRGSSVTMAERMFETIAEGHVSLLDLVLDEDILTSPRPTFKGHVKLISPSGRHLASLEFRLTARVPFASEFIRLVKEAYPEGLTTAAGCEGEEFNGVAGGTSAASEEVQQCRDAPRGAGGKKLRGPRGRRRGGGVREWVEMSSSSSGTRQWNRYTAATRSGMQLRRTRDRGSTSSSTSPDSYFYTDDGSEASSSVLAMKARMRRQQQQSPALRRKPVPPPQSGSILSSQWLSPTKTEGDTTYHWGASQTPAHSLAQGTGDGSRLTHVPQNLLQGGFPLHSGGQLQYQSGEHTIHSLSIDVERLELPTDMLQPLPRLSCYYSVLPLHQEVHLAAPATAQYTVTYNQQQYQSDTSQTTGIVFSGLSLGEVAEVVRQPLTFFLTDEDAPHDAAAAAASTQLWALAVCEWIQALQCPGSFKSFALSLLRRSDNSVIPNATLRVRLMVSNSVVDSAAATPTPGGYERGPARQLYASHLEDSTHAARGGMSGTSVPRRIGRNLSELGETHVQQGPGPLPSAPPPSGPIETYISESMDEEILRLELERLKSKGSRF